jgi:hypothetical protein
MSVSPTALLFPVIRSKGQTESGLEILEIEALLTTTLPNATDFLKRVHDE